MKYFKDENNKPFAFEDDAPSEFYVSLISLSESEFNDLVAEINAPTAEQLVIAEQSWVASELAMADIELNKCIDGHARKAGTQTGWKAYRNQLRDHIIGGVVQGDRPVYEP